MPDLELRRQPDARLGLRHRWHADASAARRTPRLQRRPGAARRCVAGLGIAWRSTWEIGEELASGRLVSVLDGYAAPPNGIYAVFAHARHLPLRVRVWVDFLKETYGDAAYWKAGADGQRRSPHRRLAGRGLRAQARDAGLGRPSADVRSGGALRCRSAASRSLSSLLPRRRAAVQPGRAAARP